MLIRGARNQAIGMLCANQGGDGLPLHVVRQGFGNLRFQWFRDCWTMGRWRTQAELEPFSRNVTPALWSTELRTCSAWTYIMGIAFVQASSPRAARCGVAGLTV
jgi:hypothetical protein